jgi:hypothetical protein
MSIIQRKERPVFVWYEGTAQVESIKLEFNSCSNIMPSIKISIPDYDHEYNSECLTIKNAKKLRDILSSILSEIDALGLGE